MIRARQVLTKGLPVGAGVLCGALLATTLAGQPAVAGAVQDPTVQMQVQQALNNFQVQLQTELNLMRSRIDVLERQNQSLRMELSDARREEALAATPIPTDPIPGTRTFGRLVSESTESYRFELHSPTGELLGQLGLTADGPGLVLLDAGGQISVALLATPDGPELRMVDAEGTLQTVLSGR